MWTVDMLKKEKMKGGEDTEKMRDAKYTIWVKKPKGIFYCLFFSFFFHFLSRWTLPGLEP